MLDLTKKALEEFDNQHDFERMCADILNALGNRDVVLMAPRGGGDAGRDITFTYGDNQKGIACVTLRKDIGRKFKEDFSRRKPGEYDKYMLFCTAYLTSSQKLDFARFCLDNLRAEFVPQDIEAIRSLLDSGLKDIRRKYLNIEDAELNRRRAILAKLRAKYILSHDGISSGMLAGLDPLPKEWVERELRALGEKWRQDQYY